MAKAGKSTGRKVCAGVSAAGSLSAGASSQRPSSSMHTKDKVMSSIKAYARLRPEERRTLLTDKGARERVKQHNITLRQSMASLPPGALMGARGGGAEPRPPPQGRALAAQSRTAAMCRAGARRRLQAWAWPPCCASSNAPTCCASA